MVKYSQHIKAYKAETELPNQSDKTFNPHFLSTEVPGEPLNCRINKTNKDCMFVAWDRPESDGGSPITGFYIERKERNSLLWVKANDAVVRTTEYPCAGLIEGLEYTFRVSAINRAGQGKPSKKTDFVTARTPVGRYTHNTLLLFMLFY